MIRTSTLVLIAALAGTALADDSIELNDGRIVEGDIVREEKDWIGIKSGEDVVWIERKEIRSLARDKGDPAPAVKTESTGQQTEKPAEKPREEPVVRADTGTGSGKEPRPAPAVEMRQTDGAGASAKPARETKDADHSAEANRIQQALRSDDAERRVAAADWIVETWPKWRDALEIALKEPEELPRLEAVRLLDDERIPDPMSILQTALRDDSGKVRCAALRVARHRGLADAEARAIELMRTDPMWVVRQEAIRTLEDIGGRACLPHVMAAWSSELDKDRKRRYRRVMTALLGEDLGDDVAAWYRAADEVFMGTREIRGGAAEK